ncbi:ABC transporter substrate-binding protein [Jatrophihabitans sp.]|uniref:ABC transporter substrate-binding protein n=1 Tax=Jatrophihabitans sp. TaxID=1932789 RepID=UPI0030C6F4AD|nr:putative transporter substrate binding protein [Jatrophihabitans sp.]
MRRSIRRATVGTAAAVLTLALAACSSSGGSSGGGGSSSSTSTGTATTASCTSTTKVKLQLQWSNQAQFAGYYAADKLGYYKAACLKVTLLEGGGTVVPQQVIENGQADYAVSWAPKVFGDIDAGKKLTDIAQIFQRSAPLLVSLKSAGITSPADLKGKKWVNWGYGNQWELLAMLQTAGGLSPAETKYDTEGDTPTNLFQDKYAAVTAMTYNEYAQLLETVNPSTGKLYQPSDFNVLSPNDYKSSMLEDGIWAMTDKLSDPTFKKTTEAFVYASLEGWIYVRDHPQDAATLSTQYGSKLPAGHQLWMANEINKLIWPSPQGIGVVDNTTWQQTVDLSKKVIDPATGKALIKNDPPASTIDMDFVNEALTKLKAKGLDVTGTSFKPLTVTLKKGGA